MKLRERRYKTGVGLGGRDVAGPWHSLLRGITITIWQVELSPLPLSDSLHCIGRPSRPHRPREIATYFDAPESPQTIGQRLHIGPILNPGLRVLRIQWLGMIQVRPATGHWLRMRSDWFQPGQSLCCTDHHAFTDENIDSLSSATDNPVVDGRWLATINVAVHTLSRLRCKTSPTSEQTAREHRTRAQTLVSSAPLRAHS